MTFRIVNVRSDESVLVRDIDGAFRGSMLVSFLMEDDLNQIYQLGFEGQIRETGTETWRSSFLLGPSTTEARFYNVEVGTEYDIRFRFIYSNETIGAWVSSWDDLDDDGNVIGTNTSHTVVGNTRLPPDITNLEIKQTILDSLIIIPSVPWQPQDYNGYEFRYFSGTQADFPGGVYDWDVMTTYTVARTVPYETTDFIAGQYTFAVKLLTNAANPAGDPDLGTFPKRFNESANAFFVEYTVLDPRPLITFMAGAIVTPIAVSTVPAAVGGYSDARQTVNAVNTGMTYDQTLGTITVPNDGAHYYSVKCTLQVNSANLSNDTIIILHFGGNTAGDVVTDTALKSSAKDDILSLRINVTRELPANETMQLGLSIDSGTSSVTIAASNFELERVAFG